MANLQIRNIIPYVAIASCIVALIIVFLQYQAEKDTSYYESDRAAESDPPVASQNQYDNAGDVSFTTGGDLKIGIGNGASFDSNGELEFRLD